MASSGLAHHYVGFPIGQDNGHIRDSNPSRHHLGFPSALSPLQVVVVVSVPLVVPAVASDNEVVSLAPLHITSLVAS